MPHVPRTKQRYRTQYDYAKLGINLEVEVDAAIRELARVHEHTISLEIEAAVRAWIEQHKDELKDRSNGRRGHIMEIA